MRCAVHPDVETGLACGKCGKPICPKCMVHTPVGSRCPACAGLEKLPTYHVSTSYYVRGILVALAAAIVGGIAWGVLDTWLPFNLNLVLGAFLGLGIAEVVGLATNRKRGLGLILVCSLALVLSYIVSLLFAVYLLGIPFNLIFRMSLSSLLFDLAGLAIGTYAIVNRLR